MRLVISLSLLAVAYAQYGFASFGGGYGGFGGSYGGFGGSYGGSYSPSYGSLGSYGTYGTSSRPPAPISSPSSSSYAPPASVPSSSSPFNYVGGTSYFAGAGPVSTYNQYGAPGGYDGGYSNFYNNYRLPGDSFSYHGDENYGFAGGYHYGYGNQPAPQKPLKDALLEKGAPAQPANDYDVTGAHPKYPGETEVSQKIVKETEYVTNTIYGREISTKNIITYIDEPWDSGDGDDGSSGGGSSSDDGGSSSGGGSSDDGGDLVPPPVVKEKAEEKVDKAIEKAIKKAACEDDPTGDVKSQGVTCQILKDSFGCAHDLSTLSNVAPKGTPVETACPVTCGTCTP